MTYKCIKLALGSSRLPLYRAWDRSWKYPRKPSRASASRGRLGDSPVALSIRPKPVSTVAFAEVVELLGEEFDKQDEVW